MNKAQKRIETIHHRLMDIRDSTPTRRGFITADKNYARVYLHAYKTGNLTEFYAAVEKFRHFLQDGGRSQEISRQK